MYLAEDIEPASTNILTYWRIKSRQFPALSQMARDFLAIPLAGVGVERAFSTGRDVVPYRRNRLNADTISNIMICKTHWRELTRELDSMAKEDFDCNDGEEDPFDTDKPLSILRKDWQVAKDLDISDCEEVGNTSSIQQRRPPQGVQIGVRDRLKRPISAVDAYSVSHKIGRTKP